MHNLQMSPLPDFSKGEKPRDSAPRFEHLFGQPSADQVVIREARMFEELAPIEITAPVVTQGSPEALANSELPTTILLSEHEKIIQDIEAVHDAKLKEQEARNQQLVGQELEKIRATIADTAVERLERPLAEVLAPLIGAKVARDSINALAAEALSIIENKAIDHVELCGPPELLEPLCGALEPLQESGDLTIKVRSTDCTDAIIKFDNEVLTTRVEAWQRKLAEVLS